MPRKFNYIFFVKYWLPVYGWALAIFFFSSLPAPSLPKSPYPVDKLFHLIEYGIFSFLLSRVFRNAGYRFSRRFIYFLSVLIAFLYGLSDEFHQYFVPGRDCSIWDALSDMIGAAIGAYIYKRNQSSGAV